MKKVLRPVSVDGIEFDALMEEDRGFEADSPDYPTESGFSVNDTIILKPRTLDMILYLTDTPVTWKARFGSQKNRVQDVIKKLEDLYFARKLITVITTDQTYKNMAIVSFHLKKTLETGYAREIPIGFKQLGVTESQTTTIPDIYGKSGETGTNAGAANVTQSDVGSGEASAGTENKGTILFNMAKSVGLFGG
jgi:hypothetical protein